MKLTSLLILTLLCCGCGQTLQQSQTLTFAPEPAEEEPTPPPDRTFVVSNGQVSSLVFTPDGFYNGTNPPVTAASPVTGSLNIDSETNNHLELIFTQDARTLRFGVLNGADALITGQLYTPFFNEVGPGAFLNLEDLTSGRRSWLQNAATVGGLTIVALTDTAIEVDFSFAQIQPNFRQGSGDAQGSFALSGHLTADLTPLQ